MCFHYPLLYVSVLNFYLESQNVLIEEKLGGKKSPLRWVRVTRISLTGIRAVSIFSQRPTIHPTLGHMGEVPIIHFKHTHMHANAHTNTPACVKVMASFLGVLSACTLCNSLSHGLHSFLLKRGSSF